MKAQLAITCMVATDSMIGAPPLLHVVEYIERYKERLAGHRFSEMPLAGNVRKMSDILTGRMQDTCVATGLRGGDHGVDMAQTTRYVILVGLTVSISVVLRSDMKDALAKIIGGYVAAPSQIGPQTLTKESGSPVLTIISTPSPTGAISCMMWTSSVPRVPMTDESWQFWLNLELFVVLALIQAHSYAWTPL